MNKAPAFQFYAQDFLTGVMYLTNEEIGIYIKMLAKQWTDGKIPKKRLGFLVGFDWDKLSDELQGKFIEKDGFLINQRLEKEREKHANFSKKQSKNGKKGGRPRKNEDVQDAEIEYDDNPEKPKPFYRVNPNKNQKKPLEGEGEGRSMKTEEEKGKGKKKKSAKPKPKIVNPWPNKNFEAQWQHWKIYKAKELSFKYKTQQSEQAALNSLATISNGHEKQAIAIMHQSMANGWKGFFELKNNNQNANGSNNYGKSDADLKRETSDAVDQMFGGR